MSIWGDIVGIGAGASIVDVTDAWAPDIWQWMQDSRAQSLDDYGPQTPDALAVELTRRRRDECLYGVTMDGQPSGVIGVCPVTNRLAMLHGVLFAKEVRGTGVARAAMRHVLDSLWARGIVKVSATYFADNGRVRAFLKRLGAVDEGYLRAHTMRDGKPIDLRLVAFFQE